MECILCNQVLFGMNPVIKLTIVLELKSGEKNDHYFYWICVNFDKEELFICNFWDNIYI